MRAYQTTKLKGGRGNIKPTPAAPTNVSSSLYDAVTARTTWQDPSDAVALTSYKVYRSVDGGAYTLRATINPVSYPAYATFDDTPLGVGNYQYRVTCVSTQGVESAATTAPETVVITSSVEPTVLEWNIPDEPYALPFAPVEGVGGTYDLSQYVDVPVGVTPVYTLTTPFTGISVDSSTGLLTVDETAVTDSYTLVVDLGDASAVTVGSFSLLSAATQSAAPFMSGVVFPRGAVASQQTLTTSEPNARVVVKRRWNDGSVKHAIVVGRTDLTGGVAKSIEVKTGAASGGTNLTAANIQTAAPTATVQLGMLGTVSLSALLASPFRTWISTPEMVECHYRASVDASLAVWFHVRLWAGGRMWVRAAVENGYINQSPATQTYQATVIIGGAAVLDQSLTHYAHTRWVAEGWIGGDPGISVGHTPASLIATKLVPNYWKRTPSITTLNALIQTYTPMARGVWPLTTASGGWAPHIGLLPSQDALYVTTGDSRAFNATVASSKALGAYSLFRRSSVTHRLIKLSDFPLTTYVGDGTGRESWSNANGTWDVSHAPNAGYLAYLTTGDYLHLESLGFSAQAFYGSVNSNRGAGTSRIMSSIQTRGTGWGFNIVGSFAAIAPTESEAAADSEVVAEHRTWLANNAAWFAGEIDRAGMNQIGTVYQYSTSDDWGQLGSVAPWMTDFWVAANGQISDMDAVADTTALVRLRDWMYRWIVGRFGPTGAAYYHFSKAGSEYGIKVDPTAVANSFGPDEANFYDSWGDVWTGTYGTPNAETTNSLYRTNPGASNDPAVASRNHRWGVALMAMAYAKDHAATGADEAWARFTGADNWSSMETGSGATNFADIPLLGIVPRGFGGT